MDKLEWAFLGDHFLGGGTMTTTTTTMMMSF